MDKVDSFHAVIIQGDDDLWLWGPLSISLTVLYVKYVQ
jgi:hypothetical protein